MSPGQRVLLPEKERPVRQGAGIESWRESWHCRLQSGARVLRAGDYKEHWQGMSREWSWRCGMIDLHSKARRDFVYVVWNRVLLFQSVLRLWVMQSGNRACIREISAFMKSCCCIDLRRDVIFDCGLVCDCYDVRLFRNFEASEILIIYLNHKNDTVQW